MSKAHKALINVSIYVHELEPTGEIGKSIGLGPTRDLGLKNFILTVGPDTKEGVAQKALEIIGKIKELQ